MFVTSDWTDLLRFMESRSVRYLGDRWIRCHQYAEPRFTKDLDLWISTDPNNAAAVYAALRDSARP